MEAVFSCKTLSFFAAVLKQMFHDKRSAHTKLNHFLFKK